MNLKLEIENIKHQLEEMKDEQLVEAIKKIVSFANSKNYESGLNPMTREELIKRATLSNNDIQQGKTENIESVLTQAKKWEHDS